MKLPEFIQKLKKACEHSVLKANVSRLLYKKDKEIIALLRAHSPYDPESGAPHFRDQWMASKLKYGSSKVLAQLIVVNKTPIYGRFMVEGAVPGKAPWYYPHKNNDTKRTGKLNVFDGKVWAGGLNPGHDKTMGGPIVQVLGKVSDKITQEVSREFVKGFI